MHRQAGHEVAVVLVEVELRRRRDPLPPGRGLSGRAAGYPGPDRSVRLEQLRSGRAQPRRYRNRRIGEFLKEIEFTEGRGTGIPKIIRAMRQNGSSPRSETESARDCQEVENSMPLAHLAWSSSGEALTLIVRLDSGRRWFCRRR
jgi:Putative ATP-dependent DNA helicase recG C-terminal